MVEYKEMEERREERCSLKDFSESQWLFESGEEIKDIMKIGE